MNIEEALMMGKSGYMSAAVYQYVANNPSSMKQLMDCFFSHDMRLSQRSVIPIGKIAAKHSKMLEPYIKQMLKAQEKPYNTAIRRNVIRTIMLMDLPEKYRGQVFDICLQYVNDVKEAIAVRAFAIAICGDMCKHYPELKVELIETLELHENFGSPGFRSQAKRVKRELQKL
jgi:hypothetical protein